MSLSTNLPNHDRLLSFTLAPGLSPLGSVPAPNVIVCSVSPALNVTLVGRVKSAPPWFVATRGMPTVRFGSRLSVTVTVTMPPSGTV